MDANLTKVNFLDVTLNLKSGRHSPYKKEGNTPLYAHKQSNHPPSILRNILESINKRLQEISSDKDCFDMAKGAIKTHLIKVDTNITCPLKSQPLVRHESAQTAKETSRGSTHRTAKM